MFRIEYKIINEFNGKIDILTDMEISYDFILGSVYLISSDTIIEMEWEWIPLLDFAYNFKLIANNLNINNKSKDYFEFTENAETINFLKDSNNLKIIASFSPNIILTTLKDFEIAVSNFHLNLSNYIRENILYNQPLPKNLKKYLFI